MWSGEGARQQQAATAATAIATATVAVTAPAISTTATANESKSFVSGKPFRGSCRRLNSVSISTPKASERHLATGGAAWCFMDDDGAVPRAPALAPTSICHYDL